MSVESCVGVYVDVVAWEPPRGVGAHEVLFYRARACTFEGYCVSSSQRSAGVSEAQTTTAALLSSSLTCPCQLVGGFFADNLELNANVRPPWRTTSVHRLARHTVLAAFPRYTSTWWIHVAHVLVLLGTCAGRSNCTALLGISCQFSSGTLHGTRWAQQRLSGIFLELVATVVPALAVQVTLPYGTIRGYVLDVDLANVLGVVVIKWKQGLLVLTCWSFSRYFFTLLLRCMGVTCGTRTFSLSLRESDGSEGGGEFASMIRSRRLGGLSSSGLAVLGSRSLRSCGLISYVSFFQ